MVAFCLCPQDWGGDLIFHLLNSCQYNKDFHQKLSPNCKVRKEFSVKSLHGEHSVASASGDSRVLLLWSGVVLQTTPSTKHCISCSRLLAIICQAVSLHVSASQSNCSNNNKKNVDFSPPQNDFIPHTSLKPHVAVAQCPAWSIIQLNRTISCRSDLLLFLCLFDHTLLQSSGLFYSTCDSPPVWSIWSTNYTLCAMITCALQHSGNYVVRLHIPEVSAVTCHPSERTFVAFCSIADLIYAVRVRVDHCPATCWLQNFMAWNLVCFRSVWVWVSPRLSPTEAEDSPVCPSLAFVKYIEDKSTQIHQNGLKRRPLCVPSVLFTVAFINLLSKVTECTRHRQCWSCSEMSSEVARPALA